MINVLAIIKITKKHDKHSRHAIQAELVRAVHDKYFYRSDRSAAVCVCVRACACLCVCMCVRALARAHLCVCRVSCVPCTTSNFTSPKGRPRVPPDGAFVSEDCLPRSLRAGPHAHARLAPEWQVLHANPFSAP